MSVPRSEYPRPQFLRDRWLCLNGEWQFEIDHGDSGLARGLLQRDLAGRIFVPFCPESSLSGLGHTDFLSTVWYRRTVTIPPEWAGQRILLHFQAVDYDASVWIDGRDAGRHRGGSTPFTCDITDLLAPGLEAIITLRARDDYRHPQPRGKQSSLYANHGCHYTRTTGIWQTVWLEPVPPAYLGRARLTPDLSNSAIHLEQPVTNAAGLTLHASLSDDDGLVSQASCSIADFSPRLTLPIPENRRHLWSPGNPYLYQLVITLHEGDKLIDRLTSYAALRSITIDGKAVLLNGQPLFQRLVLDQGYYPDGILTAPSDRALARDIELSIAAGFNGARLHQKIFEERFLYHADRLGYLAWGEFPDWGCGGFGPDLDHQKPGPAYLTEWLEVLARDYSHPSIIGWCPLNETWQILHDDVTLLDDVTRGMFLAAKAMDPTRPVLDASGYSHRVPESDIYDSHDYDQNPDSFRRRHAALAQGEPFVNRHNNRDISVPYRGQPYFVSEFGGTWWQPDAADSPNSASWGYGDRPRSLEEFYQRFEFLCHTLLDDPDMFGYCYTQLTDVFQEQNGIYQFDRSPKFDLERLRSIQQKQAAIERLS